MTQNEKDLAPVESSTLTEHGDLPRPATSPSAHTPGPWRCKEGWDSNWMVIGAPHRESVGGDLVAEVSDYPRCEANARLIAAAPELLTAVHAALAYVVATGDLGANTEASGLQAVLRAAIREAEGRSA